MPEAVRCFRHIYSFCVHDATACENCSNQLENARCFTVQTHQQPVRTHSVHYRRVRTRAFDLGEGPPDIQSSIGTYHDLCSSRSVNNKPKELSTQLPTNVLHAEPPYTPTLAGMYAAASLLGVCSQVCAATAVSTTQRHLASTRISEQLTQKACSSHRTVSVDVANVDRGMSVAKPAASFFDHVVKRGLHTLGERRQSHIQIVEHVFQRGSTTPNDCYKADTKQNKVHPTPKIANTSGPSRL